MASVEQYGQWRADRSLGIRTTTADTRSLSVVSSNVVNPPEDLPVNGSAITALLYYQNQNMNLTALVRYASRCDWVGCLIDEGWLDISGQTNASAPLQNNLNGILDNITLYGSAQHAAIGLGAPFISVGFQGAFSNSTNLSSTALFYSTSFYTPSTETPSDRPKQDGVLQAEYSLYNVSTNSHYSFSFLGTFLQSLTTIPSPLISVNDRRSSFFLEVRT